MDAVLPHDIGNGDVIVAIDASQPRAGKLHHCKGEPDHKEDAGAL